MRSRFGVDDYKLVLDESTTTPDLIDQNTIYAKLLLKPTKAVEFFLIDFVRQFIKIGFKTTVSIRIGNCSWKSKLGLYA